MTTPNGSQTAAAATVYAGPASFQLDPAASTVSITHKTIWGLVTVRGSFSKLSGSAEILPDGSGRGRIEIDAASIDTKQRKRDEHLRSKDFFNAGEHPQIVVDLPTATRQGEDSVTTTGTLTAAGQSRPLTVTARITQATDQAITLTAEADIDRTDFGMRWNQLGMITGKAHASVVARFVRSAAGQ
ncbi:MAG TPA: YceI family protein [Streptosporangiaceae bacterium]|nr:YceI family protein [Streptosporangiaceae bacterium]